MEFLDKIDVEAYNELRELVGWGALPQEEAEAGIQHSFFTISCIEDGRTVGVARIIWDCGYIAFLSDVMVNPKYQGKGIGKEMVKRLVEQLEEKIQPGWRVKVSLMSASNKEIFYEKMGFVRRPHNHGGAGMERWICK